VADRVLRPADWRNDEGHTPPQVAGGDAAQLGLPDHPYEGGDFAELERLVNMAVRLAAPSPHQPSLPTNHLPSSEPQIDSGRLQRKTLREQASAQQLATASTAPRKAASGGRNLQDDADAIAWD